MPSPHRIVRSSHPTGMTLETLDDLTLVALDGTPFPLERLRGAPSVIVLMRHLA